MSTQTLNDKKAKQDELFRHLSYIADLFQQEGIAFQIADGTLLGAVREGDILEFEERDFDLDIIDSEVPKVRKAAQLASKDGYEIVERTPNLFDFDIGYDIWNMKAERSPNGGAGFLISYKGEFVGDIYIYTVFNDGIARRYCLQCEASVNAKMSIPAWLLEESKSVKIRGKEFPGSRAPEKLLAKTYGDDWETPIAPGEFGPGRHPDSGGIYDSNMEHLVIDALDNGWNPDYSNKEPWSRRIRQVGSYAGRRWTMRHDPFYIIEDKLLFTNEEREALKKRIEANPSEAAKNLIFTVICARTNMNRQDVKAELKSTRQSLTDVEGENGELQNQLSSVNEKLTAIIKEHEAFKSQVLIKAASSVGGFLSRLQKLLRREN